MSQYLLEGVILKPREQINPNPRIYQYLNFVVRGKSEIHYVVTGPLLFDPDTEPEDNYPRSVIQEISVLDFMRIMHGKLYRKIDKKYPINLETQVVCQSCEGVFIANAKAIHRDRITLRNAIKRIVREKYS